MGNPSGVVHTTVVICSLRKRVVTPFFFLEADDPSSSMASRTRSPGTDFEIIRAEAVSQVMISFAPWNKSPMHCSTWGAHQNPFIWREGTSLYLLGEVCRSKVTFPKRNITAFLQLPLNLIPRADECDTIYGRHDRLLHNFPRDLADKHCGKLIVWVPLQIIFHSFLDHIGNVCIYV